MFSYFTLKALYFPAPSDWSTVTFGLVTVISVSVFVTSVSDVEVEADGCSTEVSAAVVTGDSDDVGSTLVVTCVEVAVVVGKAYADSVS